MYLGFVFLNDLINDAPQLWWELFGKFVEILVMFRYTQGQTSLLPFDQQTENVICHQLVLWEWQTWMSWVQIIYFQWTRQCALYTLSSLCKDCSRLSFSFWMGDELSTSWPAWRWVNTRFTQTLRLPVSRLMNIELWISLKTKYIKLSILFLAQQPFSGNEKRLSIHPTNLFNDSGKIRVSKFCGEHTKHHSKNLLLCCMPFTYCSLSLTLNVRLQVKLHVR